MFKIENVTINNQWRIQECQKGGGGRGPGALEFLGLGFVFDAPSHIPFVFVARVVNKIHNVNNVY